MAKERPQGTRRFGPLTAEVPLIGQGTWLMGEGSAADRQSEIAALRAGLERGLTHIDTAELYGSGRAEEMIADVIGPAGLGAKREDLFIVSKVLPQNASYQGTIRACEASLKRLRTSYLDVYLLHWRGPHPLGDTLSAMQDLLKAGKIRALGVSNFGIADLEEARALLTRQPIACNQVLYHLQQRFVDAGLVAYCQRHDIALVGYSPFGHGHFPKPGSKGGKVLAAVAARHGATPRQVALAFLVRQPPLFTIPKASRVEHVEDNAAALELVLGDQDIAEIDAAFPVPPAAASEDGEPPSI
jgi:diketogulonate reductase-like aldo/keto reductase